MVARRFLWRVVEPSWYPRRVSKSPLRQSAAARNPRRPSKNILGWRVAPGTRPARPKTRASGPPAGSKLEPGVSAAIDRQTPPLSQFSAEARALVEENVAFVWHIAHIYARRFPIPVEDLAHEGFFGLMVGAHRFDFSRGVAFTTYAAWWIRHAISRYIADFGATVRLPVHMGEKLSRASDREWYREVAEAMPGTPAGAAARARLDRVVGNIPAWSLRGPVSMRRPSARSRTEDGSSLPALEIDAIAADVEDPIQRLEEERVRANLAAAIDRLAAEKPTAADVVRRRFGIGREPETLAAIGEDLGLTRERIRQIEAIAIRWLREDLDADDIDACAPAHAAR